MSFDRIEGFLKTEIDKVGLDQLFVLLNNVIDDVCKFDGVESISDLDLRDESVRRFAQTFSRLSGALISTYSTTKDRVNNQKEHLKRQFEVNSNEIMKIDAQLNETMKTIKAEEKNLLELEAKKKELDHKKEQFLIIKEECEKLREKNNELSKIDLEKLKQDKLKLQEELTEREANLTTVVNACKSALSDDFLKKNLFKAAEGSDSLSVSYPDLEIAEAHFDNFDELGQWLENINARIKGLMIVYEKQLAEIIKWAEDLTADKSDK